MLSITRSSYARSYSHGLPYRRGIFSSLAPRTLKSPETRRKTLSLHRTPKYDSRTYAVSSTQNCSSDTHSEELVLSDAQRRTIYALSTPPGKAGVAVVRISGPDAMQVWAQMVRAPSGTKEGKKPRLPVPWKMERCRVVDPLSEEVLDDGLVVFFKGPRSFTTEDVVELHIHSGRAIISAILSAISRLPFCRLAEPGEFTRRAFEGGRLDLTQVEGLKDLIDAETDGQRKAALRAVGGTARVQFEELRQEIIKCLALVEALIDFGEGEDIEEGVFEQARSRAERLRDRIKAILSDNRRGEIVRSGVRLAIFGPPNAGKSSLLNFFAQREAAIVTHIPGTTRDVLELELDIGGLLVVVADTAGLRKTDDVVEAIGVRRAEDAVRHADVSLLVLSLPDIIQDSPSVLGPTIPTHIASLLEKSTYILLNKSDLVPSSTLKAIETVVRETFPNTPQWTASLANGEGTTDFLQGFATALQTRYNLLEDQGSLNAPLITHARHRTHLESALLFLDAFLEASAEDIVLGAEELRYAAQAVGKISGLIDVEDILDVVFRDFCIGK